MRFDRQGQIVTNIRLTGDLQPAHIAQLLAAAGRCPVQRLLTRAGESSARRPSYRQDRHQGAVFGASSSSSILPGSSNRGTRPARWSARPLGVKAGSCATRSGNCSEPATTRRSTKGGAPRGAYGSTSPTSHDRRSVATSSRLPGASGPAVAGHHPRTDRDRRDCPLLDGRPPRTGSRNPSVLANSCHK